MVPAWLIQVIEALSYGASRGFWKAKLELDREGIRATVEIPHEEDNDHIRNFRDAVGKLRVGGTSDPRWPDPSPVIPPTPGVGMGGKT